MKTRELIRKIADGEGTLFAYEVLRALKRAERLEKALVWIRDTSSNPHIKNRANEALKEGAE